MRSRGVRQGSQRLNEVVRYGEVVMGAAMPSENPPRVWTLEELMSLFRVCDKTIRKWIDLGRLTRLPDCAKVRVTDESVQRLLKGGGGAI